MSSETSTESFAEDVKVPRRAEPLQPWQLFTLAGLVGATIVVLVSSGQTPAGVVLLSLIVFAAAAVGVAALRTLLPLTGSARMDIPQVLGGRTRAALERDKALVLRSIKELEFDRAMGKISEKDFAEMGGRLRSRAARLIRQLDAGAGYRQQIDQEIERRVTRGHPVRAGGVPAPAATGEPRATACASCRTANDPDARFCKNCGTALGAAS
jgi:hypothetical protein